MAEFKVRVGLVGFLEATLAFEVPFCLLKLSLVFLKIPLRVV